MTELLRSTLEGGVLRLTLNRPDKRNALNAALLDAMQHELERADLEAAVRVVVLDGAGRDFCAGADLDELLVSADHPPEVNAREAMRLGDVLLGLQRIPKPVIAVVHGRALAGGCGLATACDIVLAHPEARFGYPEIQRGFVPAMVMAFLRHSVGEKRAFDLVATGRVLSAAEAVETGLASRVLSADAFPHEVTSIATALAATSPSAIALLKRQFYALDGLPLDEGVRLGANVNAVARATPEFRDAVRAFLER